MSIGKGEARTMVGRRVLVNSGRVQGVTGEIRSYREKTHQFLVYMDEARPSLLGRLNEWHTCPVGCVKLL